MFAINKILFVLLLLLMPVHGWAAVSYIQLAQGNDQDGNATQTITFSINVTAGSTVMGAGTWIPTSATLNSVTVCGNAATIVDNPTANGTNMAAAQFYYANVSAGACSVVMTYSTNVTGSRFVAHEVSGIDTTTPLDNAQHNCRSQANPTGTDSVASNAITTTVNGDYVFGFTGAFGGATVTAGTGFTIRQNITTRNTEDQVQGSAGSITATFTPSGNDQWLTCVMAFQPTGGGGGGGSTLHNLMLLGIGR